VNVPFRPGATTRKYCEAFDQVLWPALEGFRPDLLLVSAGFDAHRDDPLGGMRVDDAGYEALVRRLSRWAEALCHGRWLVVLEGGYEPDILGRQVAMLARVLLEG
jgi:acetoin utilization deacetylase AcuC-like enzyme